MPVRQLNLGRIDPYRNLQERDPAVNGLAFLGASLMNGTANRRAAEAAAMSAAEEKRYNAAKEQFSMDRALTQDGYRAEDRQRDDANRAEDLKRNDTNRADDIKREDEYRKSKGLWDEEDLARNDAYRSDMLGETIKGNASRDEHDNKRLEETARHNKVLEEAGVTGKQKEMALLATDIWNKSRYAATESFFDKESGITTRKLNPTLHKEHYEKLRKLSGRDDIPPWDAVEQAKEEAGYSEGDEDLQGQPTATSEPVKESRSLIGRMWDGVMGSGGGNVPVQQLTPDQEQARKQFMAGAGSFGFVSPNTMGYPPPTKATPTQRPQAPDLFNEGASIGSAALPPAQVELLKGLAPDDQAAYLRILQTGDPERIKRANEILLQSSASENNAYNTGP